MSQLAVWDFTYFIEDDFNADDIMDLVECWREELGKIAKKWVFQIEKGDDSGKLHFQGRVSLIKKKYHGWWVDGWLWTETHWSGTSGTVSRKGMEFYVTKEDTRVGGPFRDDDEKIFIQDEVQKAMMKPYEWQSEILERVKIREERIVNVLCSPKGNQGRSTLIAWMDQNHLAMEVDIDSKSSPKDMMRQIMGFKKKPTYIFDLPRSYPINEPTFWEAIEKIKKGKAWDDRYKFQKEWFPIPNVWIFTNEFPDPKHLSIDRWRFWVIEEGKLQAAEVRKKRIKLN